VDFISDLRIANHLTPGLDLASDENLVEGFLADALCDDICGDRVVSADKGKDRVLCQKIPWASSSGLMEREIMPISTAPAMVSVMPLPAPPPCTSN
jgi:hypothetical protein